MSGLLTALSLVFLQTLLPAAATVIRAGALEELTVNATAVVHGQVASSSPFWYTTQKGDRYICTDTVLRLERVFKGDIRKNELVVRTQEGSIGAERTEVSGEPRFELGEEVFLFLTRGLDKKWVVLGMAQGKYSIIKNSDTSDVAKRDVSGLSFVGDVAKIKSVAGEDQLPLEDLVAKIQSAVEIELKSQDGNP